MPYLVPLVENIQIADLNLPIVFQLESSGIAYVQICQLPITIFNNKKVI